MLSVCLFGVEHVLSLTDVPRFPCPGFPLTKRPELYDAGALTEAGNRNQWFAEIESIFRSDAPAASQSVNRPTQFGSDDASVYRTAKSLSKPNEMATCPTSQNLVPSLPTRCDVADAHQDREFPRHMEACLISSITFSAQIYVQQDLSQNAISLRSSCAVDVRIGCLAERSWNVYLGRSLRNVDVKSALLEPRIHAHCVEHFSNCPA